ncbi:AAA domain-containing protein [Chitinophaga sp. G-6-1-13]|uniref:AAA domain-containing protein n=1 Tax=Chitinophaga fulva TaxID=2728842 RepID=A0A848GII8_9BACT|nr:AAA family ATPase [Chitinophaga fulva]NML37657.1 AAA domain-containing protein [Chitinophaga fulva]
MNEQLVDKLHQVLQQLKHTFIGKEDIIDLMGICLAGRENLFLLGPPGTAKSALVKALASHIDGHTFEYLLTRFTEPNEIFGPFDIRKLREGELITNTEGMLPEASFIFLDELLNANSAILNSLLMVLNERVFRRGRETRKLPALMVIGASNHLPEDEALQALYDRFLIRVKCDYVDPQLLSSVLQAGWQLEQANDSTATSISHDDIFQLQQQIGLVNLDAIRPDYLTLIQQLRNAGLQVSDRRAVKLQRLIAASALISKRTTAQRSDMWVLRYIWDTEEQQPIIAAIVDEMINSEPAGEQEHPRARHSGLPNADEIYRELQEMTIQWNDTAISPADKASIKDRLRYLNGRCEWITNPTRREYVMQPITALWQQIMQQS